MVESILDAIITELLLIGFVVVGNASRTMSGKTNNDVFFITKFSDLYDCTF